VLGVRTLFLVKIFPVFSPIFSKFGFIDIFWL
jgi:hypothetical protein